MPRHRPTRPLAHWPRRAVATVAMVAVAALTATLAPTSNAAPVPAQRGGGHGGNSSYAIELPDATGAEGIAAGRGKTFYAGDLGNGDIYRGVLRSKSAKLFIDAPDDGRVAVGMKFDRRNRLLFVAGGPSGHAYVYDTKTRQPVADFELAPGFINDVTLTRAGAWFTNSQAGELYLVPIRRNGKLGPVRTLELSGPAGETPGGFNLNGITSLKRGRVLLVAHSADATIYRVNPRTGESAATGLDLPNVDGILAKGRRVWAVQNRLNQISKIKLRRGLHSGTVKKVLTSPLFEVPTTVAKFGHKLAAPNAKFGVPNVDSYEVVVLRAHK